MKSLNTHPPGESFPHNEVEEPNIQTYNADEEGEEENPKNNFAELLRTQHEIQLEDGEPDDENEEQTLAPGTDLDPDEDDDITIEEGEDRSSDTDDIKLDTGDGQNV